MRSAKRRFVSTRGGGHRYNFRDAVLAGWADNGGMILPEDVPTVSRAMLKSWRGLGYPTLVCRLLELYLQDESFVGLSDLIHRSFKDFTTPDVVSLRSLKETLALKAHASKVTELWVAELFHGPSLAFKDLGMQVLANLLEHYLCDSEEPMCFLVGTSGDTGPSALAAVRGKRNMSLVVLYPWNRVSPTQEAQMLSAHGAGKAHADGGNCHVIAVDGTSDDLDEPIATLFQDADFRTKHRLGSLNSVNIVRLLVQVFHYFYCYLRLTADDACWEDDSLPLPKLSFSVPTGAAGHVTAGIIAALMGLPINCLVMATNENDILDVMMRRGYLEKKSHVVATNSPAMDIQAPYNIERILHLLSKDGPPNGDAIRAFMEGFYAGQRVTVPQDVMDWLRELGVSSTAISRDDKEAAVLGTIRQVYELDDYILDPHTAVGVAAALKLSIPEGPNDGGFHTGAGTSARLTGRVVSMGCAHPAKFAATVAEALGQRLADAEDTIATASHPDVSKTVGLVASLRSQAEGPCGSARSICCPQRFEAVEKAQWATMLADYVSGIEAGAL